MSHKASPPNHDIWIYAGLIVTTLLIFAQVRTFEFLTFDDLSAQWVLGPMTRRGITLEGLWWALTSGADNWWFPVTRFSHMLDVELFGINSGAHHFTSVLLHTASVAVLFAFLKRATHDVWPSAFVAFAFALHPLHVESVAWVAERKDVLCAFFWMLTLWAYVRYAERPGRGRYAAVAVFLSLSLMSKSMAVSLPAVLVLVDYWPLRRPISIWTSIKEKIPLFVLAAATGVITIVCQRRGGAAIATFPLGMRIENALVRYVLYLGKMFWPAHLAVFYPYPLAIPVWQPVLAGLTLLVVTVLCVLLRRHRYLLAGWLWYLGTMALVIGVLQSGVQAWADRYMYIPLIGLSAMLAWGVADLVRQWPRAETPMVLLSSVACAAMALITYNQLHYWKNTETLFVHALEVTDRNIVAHNSLGAYYLDFPSRLPEAIDQCEKAIAIDPDNEIAHNNLGLALLKTPDRLAEARAQFEIAVRLKPDYFEAHNNLAAALLRTPGRTAEAAAEFESAVRIKPAAAEAQYNLGAVLSSVPGRLPEAIQHLERALEISPDFDTEYALASALAQLPGRSLEARAHLQAALRLRPGAPQAVQLLRQLSQPAN